MAHNDLNLQHLMTPSGLHLTSLLIIFGFFFKTQSFQFCFLILLGLFLYPYAGLDSFKRMIIFGLFRKNPLKSFSLKSSFVLTFIVAFTLGHYFENPLSFCLSFIFIGALIMSKNRLVTFLLLAFLQVILANWFERNFSFLGIFWGLSLSLVSPLLFPLLLLELLIPSLPFSSLWEHLLLGLHSFTRADLNFNLIALTPTLIFLHKPKMRNKALIFTLLFLTLPLGKESRSGSFPAPPPRNYIKKTTLKNGTKFIYDNGMRCFSRLKEDQWSHHCYK